MIVEQCEYCGDELAEPVHRMARDLPISCGARQCERDAADDARAADAQAREAAERDHYDRYRGGYW